MPGQWAAPADNEEVRQQMRLARFTDEELMMIVHLHRREIGRLREAEQDLDEDIRWFLDDIDKLYAELSRRVEHKDRG